MKEINWRYVLVLSVDRMAYKQLNPGYLSFIERIFPANQKEEDILQEISQEYEKLSWGEENFYFDLYLYKIDISKRYDNTWKIHTLNLNRQKNGELFVEAVSIFPPSLFTCEAISHAFGLPYHANGSETFPKAGYLGDPMDNLFVNFDSQILIHDMDYENGFIFSCYSHTDKNVVYDEVEWVKNIGFDIWDDRDIPVASKWEQVIPEKIEECSLFIIFISKNSISSEDVNREISYAIKHKKSNEILPIFLEHVELPREIEFNLGPIQYLMKYNLPHETYRKKFKETLVNVEFKKSNQNRFQELSSEKKSKSKNSTIVE